MHGVVKAALPHYLKMPAVGKNIADGGEGHCIVRPVVKSSLLKDQSFSLAVFYCQTQLSLHLNHFSLSGSPNSLVLNEKDLESKKARVLDFDVTKSEVAPTSKTQINRKEQFSSPLCICYITYVFNFFLLAS